MSIKTIPSKFILLCLAPLLMAPDSTVCPNCFSSQSSPVELTVTRLHFANQLTEGGMRLSHYDEGMSVRFSAWGRGEELHEIEWNDRQSVLCDGQQIDNCAESIEIAYEGIIERWYIEEDEEYYWVEPHWHGMEQSWVIATAPGGDREEPLVLELKFEHAQEWSLTTETDVSIMGSNGGQFSYGGLKAWDANNDQLSVAMDITDSGVILIIDDYSAQYPLVVDSSFEVRCSTNPP